MNYGLILLAIRGNVHWWCASCPDCQLVNQTAITLCPLLLMEFPIEHIGMGLIDPFPQSGWESRPHSSQFQHFYSVAVSSTPRPQLFSCQLHTQQHTLGPGMSYPGEVGWADEVPVCVSLPCSHATNRTLPHTGLTKLCGADQPLGWSHQKGAPDVVQ